MFNVIFYNISLLLSLSVLYFLYSQKTEQKITYIELVLGLIISSFGLILMKCSYDTFPVLALDSRSLFLAFTAIFFGWVPTLFALVSMSIYAFLQGGTGKAAVLFMLFSASAIGMLWRKFKAKSYCTKGTENRLEFLYIGIVLHSFMIASLLFIPKDLASPIFRTNALSVLVLYPLATAVLGNLFLTIYKRNSMQARLESSEYRFKTIFNQAPVGITVTDPETGKRLAMNSEYLRILGRTEEDLLKNDWMSITHPEDYPLDLAKIKDFKAGKIASYSHDKRFLRGDGTYVWTTVLISSLRQENGKQPMTLCMVTDISERKAVEERVSHANSTDSLTGLYNRTHFSTYVNQIGNAIKAPFTIAIGDINGLYLVNNTISHDAGDCLIKELAKILSNNLRICDYCARIGGDEFIMLFPDTTSDKVLEIEDAIQKQFSCSSVNYLKRTISFGLETLQDSTDTLQQMLKRAEVQLNRAKLFQTLSIRNNVIYTIINTLHEKNKREEFHSRRVSEHCELIGKALGLGESAINELKTLGLLHDIGKIGIEENILNKPEKLTDKEWQEIKRHPEIGFRILSSVPEMNDLAGFVLAHHERLDGKGYPRGLKDSEIPLQSKIVAIADSYDAMTGERTYKQSMTSKEALLEIEKHAGTQFDRALALLFIEQMSINNQESKLCC
ncbi:PAS domain S-box/diguanylate cyclase (GGDEF) domain-containing protein [Sphaerochaeta pleomorpha str. Grapes]|uniref:PAS domain S-box/diguanylate cyclase (GGDEF) domain-containing protein n=1 Tax=Sphaerochaeta pleomorpha (strain ATCC BAA-1885 / DSM 22778 / Grapes) TaxID=158190 RepID=G8QYG7_SPHPG|nr:HD domain-containing phosphohydrolase [Sphaerochaeta pleomorpha]AEV30814.1 PAS domain S-box/diguanylate cyclase (GGDEF) domain-containing protein [Sphaerochaeta pleomorpha str. Grapes]